MTPAPSPLGSIARALAADARGLLDNRAAFFGGLGGLSIAVLLAYGAAAGLASASGTDEADAADADDAFELEFSPGTLARLGEELPEHELPQKIVIQDRRAPDAVPDTTPGVSRDETNTAPAAPSEPKPPTPPAPKDDRDPRIPIGKTPTHANTPYANELPTVEHDIGKAFGSAGGWSDLTRDGDPWATSVMQALAHMPVGAYAGDLKAGAYRFQITICKDGHIDRVLDKGGDLPADAKAAVRLALETLVLPKPTAKIAASMPTDCVKLKYVFSWTRDGVE
ncbi:MAG: hypothetical protein JNK45_25350 [Myxococcales bacterium]|nr:hypothetical protein [Myxococcales bacterium]